MSKKFIIGASIALALILGGGIGYYFWNQASADAAASDWCAGLTGGAWKNCVANVAVLKKEMSRVSSSRFQKTLRNADALRGFTPAGTSTTPVKTGTTSGSTPAGTTTGASTGTVKTAIQPTITSFTASTITMDKLVGPNFKVTLKWATANTISCTASASPETALWTGVKPTTGTVTFDSTFPAAFMKLTLTCAGEAGTTPAARTIL